MLLPTGEPSVETARLREATSAQGGPALFVLDIALSVLVGLGLGELLMRVFRLRPHGRRWPVWLVVFLASWVGGVWFAPGAMHDVGWIGYLLPFVLVGLVAALTIVLVSPYHALVTTSDRRAFEREQQAVGAAVIVFFWTLCALLVAVIVHGYWIR
jgi:hypothetical protein